MRTKNPFKKTTILMLQFLFSGSAMSENQVVIYIDSRKKIHKLVKSIGGIIPDQYKDI